MSKKPSIKLNIVFNLTFQILNIIVPLFTAPFVFRVLGKEGIGLYGYSYSIAHYFTLLCMLGILNYGSREISMVSDDKYARSKKFWEIYSIQFVFGLISLLFYCLLVISQTHSDQGVFWIQGIFVIAAMLDVSWFHFGMENFKATTLISIINKILTTVCIFLFIRTPADVYIYAAILSIGALFNNLFYWWVVSKYVSFVKPSIREVLVHLKPVLILFIPVIAINIYKYIDKIMLGAMLSVSDVGTFEAAEKLENLPMCLIAAIGTVMLPRISNMVANNQSESVTHYNKMSFLLVMFLTCGMAFGLAGIAEPFIPLFYGAGYEDSYPVLFWLLPSMVFVGWANIIRTQYLLPNRKDTLFCGSVIVGAVVNIISNIVLIPRFAAIGAAISTTIAELTVCLFQSVVANKDMGLCGVLKKVLPFMILGGIMYFSIFKLTFNNAFVTIIVRIALGCLVYGALCLCIYRKDAQSLLPKKLMR